MWIQTTPVPTGISRWLKCPVSTCTHGKRRESGALGRTAAAVRKVKRSESHSVVSDCLWPHGLYSPWNSPGQNIGVGSLSLPQGIFPTQESNPGLLHCRQILHQLSHKGSWGKLMEVGCYFSKTCLCRPILGLSVSSWLFSWGGREEAENVHKENFLVSFQAGRVRAKSCFWICHFLTCLTQK